MTAAERIDLQRLEDKLDDRFDKLEGKIDMMDVRVRTVEIATAGNIAADKRSADADTYAIGKWTVRLGTIGVVIAVCTAVSNFVVLHS